MTPNRFDELSLAFAKWSISAFCPEDTGMVRHWERLRIHSYS
ncbi:hypothetical protein HDF09_002223 [Edaphobacter lichenicola]|uniref:Uncharacterized protein n=1 Tax=Tunturiibacter empetritectus TaxID=3069691 RepID=A0A7W8II21_9BACT|nr:hypothetical protein [Edaphobacter lichenicola]